jgi:hypothetical protein
MFVVPCAHAGADDNKGNVIEKPVYADTPDKFAEQSAWIETQMKTGGRYEYTSDTDKRHVRDLLAEMAGLLQHSGSVAAMDMGTRIKLFNGQEEVNGILKHNDANRLVCERRAPVGSNLPVTTCHTYGDLAVKRLHDQKTYGDVLMQGEINAQKFHVDPVKDPDRHH